MLKQEIQEDVKMSMKSKDSFLVGTLRMLLSSITMKEKERRFKISKERENMSENDLQKGSQLTDEEIIDIISSEIKKRKDAISLYTQGNRPELAEKEQKEIDVLKKYLPEQLSEEELKKIIQETIRKTGAKEMKDMGRVMSDLTSKIKGKADGGSVSKIVKDFLSR